MKILLFFITVNFFTFSYTLGFASCPSNIEVQNGKLVKIDGKSEGLNKWKLYKDGSSWSGTPSLTSVIAMIEFGSWPDHVILHSCSYNNAHISPVVFVSRIVVKYPNNWSPMGYQDYQCRQGCDFDM